MTVSLTASVKYLRGVGPHRAAILEERGIVTAGDLLGYLPFRYEDRIRFTKIAEIIPGQVCTILAEVVIGGGGTVRFARGRSAIFHVTVRDGSGLLHARFFHGGYLQGRLKEKQRLVLHGKVEVDPYRPGRLEMVNPQIELIGARPTKLLRIPPKWGASCRSTKRLAGSVRGCCAESFTACCRISTATYPTRCLPRFCERYRFPHAARSAALRTFSAER